MSAKYVAGPDIDLDDEVVYDKRGQRITEARARQIARDTPCYRAEWTTLAICARAPFPRGQGTCPRRTTRTPARGRSKGARQHLRVDSQSPRAVPRVLILHMAGHAGSAKATG